MIITAIEAHVLKAVAIHLERLRRLLASVQLRRSDVGTSRAGTVGRPGAPTGSELDTGAHQLQAPSRRRP